MYFNFIYSVRCLRVPPWIVLAYTRRYAYPRLNTTVLGDHEWARELEVNQTYPLDLKNIKIGTKETSQILPPAPFPKERVQRRLLFYPEHPGAICNLGFAKFMTIFCGYPPFRKQPRERPWIHRQPGWEQPIWVVSATKVRDATREMIFTIASREIWVACRAFRNSNTSVGTSWR
jgi:hypothetical protein